MAALLLAFSSVRAAQDDQLPGEGEKWIRASTENFVFFSNAGENLTREIAKGLETFRSVFGRIASGMKLQSPVPTHVFVFAGDASFAPYDGRKKGSTGQRVAYFLPSNDANYIVMNAQGGNPVAVVYHEFVHSIVKNNFPNLPLWFNEGLAEFYSSVVCGERSATMGAALLDHMKLLRTKAWIPLDRLFAIDARTEEYNEADRQGMFYAESWMLVHSMMLGSAERRKATNAFLTAVMNGEEPGSAFASAFGTDRELMEKQLREYAAQREITLHRFGYDELAVKDAVVLEPLSRGELLDRLGNLLAHGPMDQLAQAEAHFRASIAIEGSRAAPHTGLGFIATREGRHDDAAKHFAKGLELDPTDPKIYILAAHDLLEQAMKPLGTVFRIPDEIPPEVRLARDYLSRSIALDPDQPEAYAEFGSTFLFERERSSLGIAALETARRLLPSRADVLFNLVQLLLRAGNRDRAQALIDRFLCALDPELADSARQSLLVLDVREARARIEKREVSEGLEILRRVRDQAKDPVFKEEISTGIGIVEHEMRRERHRAEIQRAVEVAGRGDAQRALAIVRKIRPEIDDKDLARAADAVLDRLRGGVPKKPAQKSR